MWWKKTKKRENFTIVAQEILSDFGTLIDIFPEAAGYVSDAKVKLETRDEIHKHTRDLDAYRRQGDNATSITVAKQEGRIRVHVYEVWLDPVGRENVNSTVEGTSFEVDEARARNIVSRLAELRGGSPEKR
jgi:hypothetical protein